MASATLALVFALVVFALAGEATNMWLKIAGFIIAVLLTLAGAMSGWQSTKK